LNKILYTTAILILFASSLFGQTNGTEKFIQVSGIITDVTRSPVSGVAVISKKLHKGSISERTGIYSITSTLGDTIYYRALGYKRYYTIIPESYQDRNCKLDIVLEPDTIQIKEITILPWKSYNEFLKDITKEHPVDPKIENMNDNIASIYVAIANQTNPSISPEAGFKYAMEQNFNALATKNQYPFNNLLNPFAWSKFISGLKNGLLKNQKFNKPIKAKVRKKKKKDNK
jgi:hypothetical protein